MTLYSSRDEISEQYRWDLTSIFETDEAFLAALEKAKSILKSTSHLRDVFRKRLKRFLNTSNSMTK